MNATRTKSINYLVKIAMLGSLAYLVMLLQFPVIPSAPFLKMDFSNVITLIGGFALGPTAAFFIDSVRLMFDCLIDGSTTGYVGEFSAWLLGITFSVPASYIYKKHRTFKTAVFSVILAFVLSNIMGIISNKYIMFPLFGIPAEAIDDMLVTAVLPFNCIKYSVVAIIVLLLYKPMSPILKKQYSMHNGKRLRNKDAIVQKDTAVAQREQRNAEDKNKVKNKN